MVIFTWRIYLIHGNCFKKNGMKNMIMGLDVQMT